MRPEYDVYLINMPDGKPPRILITRGNKFILEVYEECRRHRDGGWQVPVFVSRLLRVLRGMDYD